MIFSDHRRPDLGRIWRAWAIRFWAAGMLFARRSKRTDSVQSSSFFGTASLALSRIDLALTRIPDFSSSRAAKSQSGTDLEQTLVPVLYASRALGIVPLPS